MRLMSGKVKRIFALVLVLMLSLSAMAELSAAVLYPTMKVYFAPSTASEQIGLLPRGAMVTVKAVQNGWALIDWNGHLGFSKVEDMVSMSAVPCMLTDTTPVMYITRNNWNVRWSSLQKGTTVYVRGEKNGWMLISDANMNVLGYVPANLVTPY